MRSLPATSSRLRGDRASVRVAGPGVGGLLGRALGTALCSVASVEAKNLLHGEPAELGHLPRASQHLQRGDGRLHEVDRVLAAERLREDVVDTRELEDRAHGAAGDDAGSLRGGAEKHPAGPVDAGHPVGDGGPVHRDLEEVAPGVLDAFLDRERHLVRLAVADADHRALVTDHHQGGEGEAPAALDDLRHAVDLDDPLLQVAARAGAAFAFPSHERPRVSKPRCSARRRQCYWDALVSGGASARAPGAPAAGSGGSAARRASISVYVVSVGVAYSPGADVGRPSCSPSPATEPASATTRSSARSPSTSCSTSSRAVASETP